MGHVRVHETANTLSHPSKCHDCGYNGEDRSFYVDTGINTEWDGFIIICSSCFLNLVVKTYGYNPFDLIEELNTSKVSLIGEVQSDLDELKQVRQGLAILGLTATSLIRLAGFLKEENDGPGNIGTVEFHSEQLDSLKQGIQRASSEGQLDGKSIISNKNSSRVDSESDESVVSGLSLS